LNGVTDTRPALLLFTPRTAFLPKQPVLTSEQIGDLLQVPDLPDRTFCRLAIYAGMRPERNTVEYDEKLSC
jgi:hypothetical protein